MTAVELNNKAIRLEEAGDFAEARETYLRALDTQPGHLESLWNLSRLYHQTGNLREAARGLEYLVKRHPNDAAAHAALARVKADQGATGQAIGYFHRAAMLSRDHRAWSDYLFTLIHHAPDTAAYAHDTWYRMIGKPVAQTPPKLEWDGKRPLKIGYVSPNLNDSTVTKFLEPIVAHHTNKVEVTLYSDTAHEDAVTQRIRSYGHRWVDTRQLDHEQLAQRIKADKIDVAVDLTGHMKDNRLMMFARNPAPVMVNMIGYPFKTGIPGMTPITDTYAYRPADDAPDTTELPAATNGFITFGSVNRVWKISADVAAVWAGILKAVPNSKLAVLCPSGEHNAEVRQMFHRVGIDPARLKLVPTGRHYYHVINKLDIALDSFPYSGHTTVADCLWQGVPTVTLWGNTPVGKAAGHILGAAGLSDLVGHDVATYVKAAVTLANDAARLTTLRRTLRADLAADPLLDGRSVTERLEARYAALATPPEAKPTGCRKCSRKRPTD